MAIISTATAGEIETEAPNSEGATDAAPDSSSAPNTDSAPASDAPASTEPEAPESARESAERAYKELSEGKSEEEGAEDKEPPAFGKKKADAKSGEKPDANATAKKEEEDPAKQLELDPELMAPDRLNSIERQMFSNLPKGLKRAFNRSVKNLEGLATRATQETKAIRDAVAPYIPMWAEQKRDVPTAIRDLAQSQANLINPATSLQTYLAIGESLNMDFELLAQIARGEAELPTTGPDISSHPQFRALQEKVTTLESDKDRTRIHQAAQTIATEMRGVQNEVDAAGQLRYPELHNDDYLDSLKPLVSELKRTVADLSYGDALRAAHYRQQGNSLKDALFLALRDAKDSEGSAASSHGSTGLPAASTPQSTTAPRAVSAAVSVRGRVVPVATQTRNMEPPPEALKDAKSTTRWVLEQMENGNLS